MIRPLNAAGANDSPAERLRRFEGSWLLLPAWTRKNALYFLTFATVLILEFLRRPGAFTWPTMLFEDGCVFYRDYLFNPSWTTIFRPFTNTGTRYYLPIGRIAACLSGFVSTGHVPHVFNGIGLVVGAACCSVFCLPRFRRIIPDDIVRCLLCLLFAVTLDSGEVLASGTNSFWPVALAAILCCSVPPALTRHDFREKFVHFSAGFLLGCCTPGAVLAVPIAMWHLFVRYRERQWYFPLGLLISGLMQALLNLTLEARHSAAAAPFHSMVTSVF